MVVSLDSTMKRSLAPSVLQQNGNKKQKLEKLEVVGNGQGLFKPFKRHQLPNGTVKLNSSLIFLADCLLFVKTRYLNIQR